MLRQCYGELSYEVLQLSDLQAADWQRFEATMRPDTDQMRRLGHYAVETRKGRRGNGE